MKRVRRSSGPRRGWPLLANGALVLILLVSVFRFDPLAWSWHRDLLGNEPWRWLTAPWVHWGLKHTLVNAVGVVLLAWIGWRSALSNRAALAWFLALPLGQGLLWVKTDLVEVAGLSGWLHAGVAVLAVVLCRRSNTRERVLGAAVGAGLVLKLLLEAPWGPALRYEPMWGAMPVAPWAHLAGALAGASMALLMLFWRTPSRTGLAT
jgi:rhomboid family GlyGly-CTERM serine protease